MAENVVNGKAFEYACLKAIKENVEAAGVNVVVEETRPLQIVKAAYESLSFYARQRYDSAAKTGINIVSGLEPALKHGNNQLNLRIAADREAQGVNGDVRDVICVISNVWEIGISCKHNHEALKHPRITRNFNFGQEWIGISCSDDFLNKMEKITAPLIEYGENNVLWRDVKEKFDYYEQILDAYKEEIDRICKSNASAPSKLMAYWFGSHDFYKIIMEETKGNTKVEGFNMKGTLGRSLETGVAPTATVNRINYPNRLIFSEREIKSDLTSSNTTLILYFDKGWTVSLRLHNKDSKASITSLAWDIQLKGLPPEAYVNTRGWKE